MSVMRVPRKALAAVLLLATVAAPSAPAENACPDQNTHTYVFGDSSGYDSATIRSTALDDGSGGAGRAWVVDTNVGDCNAWPYGDEESPVAPGAPLTPFDWDGDYDHGIGGGFFGYGTHAVDDVCDYDLNIGDGAVHVTDFVFGNAVSFIMGEDDRDGPVMTTGPGGVLICHTDGLIVPDVDHDDCLSDADNDPTTGYTWYVRVGETCGTGGGDGGYWVFLGQVVTEAGTGEVSNPYTSGTIWRQESYSAPNGHTGRPYAVSKGVQDKAWLDG